jgi:hypothetical protein
VKKQIFILLAALTAGAASAQVYSEDFTSLSLTNSGTASFTNVHPVISTTTDGVWVKGGWTVLNNGELQFLRPADYGGLSACAMVLDGSLFTNGAGIYRLSFDFVYAMLGANRLYLELYDVDFNGGHIQVPTVYWATNYGTNMPPVSTFNGASVSLLAKHKYLGGDQNKTHTIDFQYDGSGDVLFRLGAGRENNAEWWTLRVDNLSIISPPPPADPTGLSAVPGYKKALLNWSPAKEPNVTYKIYRSTTPGVYGAPIATGLTSRKYCDSGLSNHIIYYYVVKAVNVNGKESGYSTEVAVIPRAYTSYSSKKGVGSGQSSNVQALHVGWYYNWGMSLNPDIDAGIEYVPMRYSKWWPDLTNLYNCGEFSNFLAYNEPENSGQGNTSVADAISQWPMIQEVSSFGEVSLGSPAVAGFTGASLEWITNFMSQVESMELQVDFMAIHNYPPPTGSHILDMAQWYHDTYDRDVWVTEFNAADWTGPNDYTLEQSYTWMIEMLYRMESAPHIARYAIFPWSATESVREASPVFELDVSNGVTNTTSILTPLGKLYAEYRSADTNGPYADTWYYMHNKSSRKRLYSSSGTPSTADIYTEDINANFKVVAAGNGNHFIVKRGSFGKRLGYNGSSLFWASSSATDGSVQWSISDEVNGWDFINHPGTGLRLSGNPLSMVSGATTNNAVRWAFVRANPLPTDIDSDDLPDAWEVKQFNSIAKSAGGSDDYDGDGDSDVLEYLAGTWANSPFFSFDTELTDFGGGTIEVTFNAITNRMYLLETTEELSSNTVWSLKQIAIPPANGIRSLRYTLPGNPPKLFGRIGIIEPE